MSKKVKISLLIILIIAIIYILINQNIVTRTIDKNDMPVITNAFLDKTKYFPGDLMLITVETKKSSFVKAFVENEKGYNEVNLIMTVQNNDRDTWIGQWKVRDSLDSKEYHRKTPYYYAIMNVLQ